MTDPSFLVSYSHLDVEFAKSVRACLEEVGLHVFMDELNIGPGQAVSEALRELVRSATHLVVVVSPESLKSEWVLFELGIAWAFRREIWCLLTESGLKPPTPIGHLKYIENLTVLRSDAESLLSISRARTHDKIGSVERFADRRLFRGPAGPISEIRLVGAGDRFYSISRVQIAYEHEPFNPPVALAGHMKKILAKKEAEARARSAVFFNGPNVRLIDWRENPKSGVDSTLERYSVELRLGPVSWFDFEGLNAAFRELVGESGLLDACEEYLSLSEVVDEGSVLNSKLSNILDTATTILTNDGYCGYQVRSSRVSAVPNLLTSAVAENINRYLDDIKSTMPFVRVNRTEASELPEEAKGAGYVPRGIPHPFAAVERGVGEEISRDLLRYMRPNAIKLLGLGFDLQAFHPDAFFLVTLDLKAEEVLRLARERPGTDYREGKLRFVECRADALELQADFATGKWVPAGKAALLRAVEVISALREIRNVSFAEAFEILAEEE